jgi:hypothetical protein
VLRRIRSATCRRRRVRALRDSRRSQIEYSPESPRGPAWWHRGVTAPVLRRFYPEQVRRLLIRDPYWTMPERLRGRGGDCLERLSQGLPKGGNYSSRRLWPRQARPGPGSRQRIAEGPDLGGVTARQVRIAVVGRPRSGAAGADVHGCEERVGGVLKVEALGGALQG